MKPFLMDLRTIAWRTAGARYNAARRLKQREWFATLSLAALSALSIAVAFAQKTYSPTPGTALDNYLSSLAVTFGIFLLAISLLESGAGYGARAEALHHNAELLTAFQLKLAQILAQIDTGKSVTDGEVDDLRLEYEAIKDKCSCNHMPGDDALFRASKRLAKEFANGNGKPLMGWHVALLIRARWHASAFWFFGIVWILVLGSLGYSWWIPKS
jgi:SMODS and SLOG-associating 2TM effector domain family 5